VKSAKTGRNITTKLRNQWMLVVQGVENPVWGASVLYHGFIDQTTAE
jgi:hypothetical protein